MRMYRWVKLGVSAATVAATLSVGGVAHAATETDVALHAATTATVLGVTAPTCTAGSGPDKAVDGASSNIYTDKWCVPTGQPTLTINLSGSAYGYSVSHIVVKHAGVAGESASYNTGAFRLRVVQTSSSTPLTVATVTGNTANQTSNTVSVGNVSQVQLLVDQPTQAAGATSATRIYEVEVWGTPSTTMTGRAYGLASSGLVGISPTPDTGAVSTTASSTNAPPCVPTVSGLISGHTLCAQVTTSTSPATSTATASVQDATIGVLGLPVIKVYQTSSTSTSNCSGASGSATVSSITVGGIPVNVNQHPAANTTMSVLGINMVFNEQSPEPGASHSLKVNAVHITAVGLLDVVIASSTSDVENCP